MDWVEERAAQVLERVPPWLWDGEALPVPVEDIADSVFGLLIRDVDEMGAAPGAPELMPSQELSGLLLAARGEIWVNAREARTWPTRRRFTIGHELCQGRSKGGPVLPVEKWPTLVAAARRVASRRRVERAGRAR
jgi:hypothetical protein